MGVNEFCQFGKCVQDPVKYHDAWKALCQSDGVLVPGGFGLRGVEGKIEAAKWCRMNGKPFLGVCLGLQCAVIEYARYIFKYLFILCCCCCSHS